MTIGSAAGYCQTHQIDKMFIGTEDATEPTCVKCVADATPKLGRTIMTEDPGEDYFKGKGTNAKITVLDATHSGVAKHVSQPELNRLEDVIGIAVAQLKHLPMPEDIKQFKAVQKAIKTLESLVENSNG